MRFNWAVRVFELAKIGEPCRLIRAKPWRIDKNEIGPAMTAYAVDHIGSGLRSFEPNPKTFVYMRRCSTAAMRQLSSVISTTDLCSSKL